MGSTLSMMAGLDSPNELATPAANRIAIEVALAYGDMKGTDISLSAASAMAVAVWETGLMLYSSD